MCVFKSVNIAEGGSKADFKAVLLLSLIVSSANDSERGVVPMYQAMQLESSWVKCGELGFH